MSDYKNNHYVPQWYQKGLLPRGQFDNELYYLNRFPREFVDAKRVKHIEKDVRLRGTSKCFSEEHLYSSTFGGIYSTEIEKYFFGELDSAGHHAVRFAGSFDHRRMHEGSFSDLLKYLSIQKLRTIKGLGWIAKQLDLKREQKNTLLGAMMNLAQIHCSIWTESVWLIADASRSATKFIISDHPVTVYNRDCKPGSPMCEGDGDPEIWRQGTHTFFPLNLDKILILTNLSWVRNPYQDALGIRPNPDPGRSAIMSPLDIQILRHLSEEEVRQINFIIKSRAKQFLAAAEADWLFPEKHVSIDDWASFGQGFLLMPDPRAVDFKGELIIGYQDGTSTAFDPYGLRPGQAGFSDKKRQRDEFNTFHRFRAEFSRRFGEKLRGRSWGMGELDLELDSNYANHIEADKRYNSQPAASSIISK